MSDVAEVLMGMSLERGAEVERLEALVKDYETRLTAVMLPDYKDWHDNAKSEWPEVAAATITSLREQADFFREAFDKADARVTDLEEQRASLRYTVKALIAANRPMAARVTELERRMRWLETLNHVPPAAEKGDERG